MSRTYRNIEDWYYHAKDKFWADEEFNEYYKDEWAKFKPRVRGNWCIPCCGWILKAHYHNKGRDRKPRNKPPKWFKQDNRHLERAKVQKCMVHEDYDNIPIFKNSDQWLWD